MEQKDNTQYEIIEGTPSWIEIPPSADVKPPAVTKLQELPFNELHWEDFEKLCLCLAKTELNVEFCTLYGRRGQKQHGIDIYARKSLGEKYTVYQCKQVDKFDKGDVEKVVANFLAGKWATKSDCFVLCTSLNLRDIGIQDTIEEQGKLLKKQSIAFITWDCNELNVRMKTYPEIVDDFFGREWVKCFCSEDNAKSLGTRLDGKALAKFRKEIGRFYHNVFNTQDRGLVTLPARSISQLTLEKRYVFPDLYEDREVKVSYESKSENEFNKSYEKDSQSLNTGADFAELANKKQISIPSQGTIIEKNRRPVESWLAQDVHSVILGDPGSGKSSLLRFLAIDILREEPVLRELSAKFGKYLPIWVPFGLWTTIIEKDATQANSIENLMKLWLGKWNEQQLWPLVEQALKDNRLLLLVDGLDEWSNVSAGQIALEKLQVYIQQRNTPAIVTSRPLGYNRLGVQSFGWRVAKLADFSDFQQKELIRKWFRYWITNISNYGNSEHDNLEKKVDSACREFLLELTSSADLTELAKIPLLLLLLIYLWLQKSKLPRNRFKAYSELIDHLIAEHPRRRRVDVGRTEDKFSGFTPNDIKNILAYLAYTIQKENPEGVVEERKAKKIIEDHLRDNNLGFSYGSTAAIRNAGQILEMAEANIGLIVRKSQNEIGFFHRSFLEYLAGCHIVRLPLEDQLKIVGQHFSDTQWSEVILALFQLTARASDVEKFVEVIDKGISGALDRHSAEVLFSEVTFTDLNCPAMLSTSLAVKCFEQIEESSWMPHRQRLLENALKGLRCAKTRELVKERIVRWFPERIREYQDIFRAMESWPMCPEVIECLFQGFHSEHSINKVSSAMSLAAVADGDPEIGERIAKLARNAIDPVIRIAALQALTVGWPLHDALTKVVEDAYRSVSPELKFAAIFSIVERGKQTETDLQNLLHFASIHGNLSGYRPDISSLILKGWPNSSEVKTKCLSSLQSGIYDRNKLGEGIALFVLLKGYPQDEQVVDYCIRQIKNEKFPFLSLGMSRFGGWDLLSENFRDNPKLIEAVDVWLANPENSVVEMEISAAALIGRTPIAKKKLLSMLDSTTRFWAVRSLLEGWGIQDEEVSLLLTKIAYGQTKEASTIGHLLPQIIADKDECRKRLVELIGDENCRRRDFVVDGLMRLGDLQQNPIVIDKIIEVLPSIDKNVIGGSGIIDSLIINCPWDPRVRELAKHELYKRWGAYTAIAKSYGNDAEIRNMLIEIVNPLPISLRLRIANKLGDELENQDFALSRLQLYDLERNSDIKTASSISYHKLLKLSGRDQTSAIQKLSEDIMCYGPDYEIRRQAAFSGLLILDRLDIMIDLKETIGWKDKKCSISLSGFKDNVFVARHILENWDKLKTTFGNDFWERISRHWGEGSAWEIFCPFADAYPSAKREAIDYVKSLVEMNTPVEENILNFISRVCPRSELLAKCCLNILLPKVKKVRSLSYSQIYLAAKLLGEHFKGNKDILSHLEQTGSHADGIIQALCYGWADSESVQKIFEYYEKDTRALSYETAVKLLSLKAPRDRFIRMIFGIIKDTEVDNSLLNIFAARGVINSIIYRLREDSDLNEMLTKKLCDNPTSSQKASLPRLIYSAKGLSEELREWTTNELARQLSDDFFPETGIDLVTGKIVPITYSLLAILEQ